MAMVLPKSHQEFIYLDPIFERKFFSKRKFGFVRSPGFDISPTVADPVNVGIDTDPGFSESERNNQIGGLTSNPLELQKFLNLVRHLTTILRNQSPGDIKNLR